MRADVKLSGGHDWTVKLFNASTGEAMHEIKGLESGTGAIAFSPLGFGSKMGYLAAGGWNGKFVVIDVAVSGFTCTSLYRCLSGMTLPYH